MFKLHKLTGDIERIGNDKLESLNAADIFCTKNGDIWVGGDRGLFRKKKGEDIFERIDLPSQRLASVSSIIEDDRGDIWVAACEKGFSAMTWSKKSSTLISIRFSTSRMSSIKTTNSRFGSGHGTEDC